MPNVDELISNFEILDESDDRYRYLIELGRELEPLPPHAQNEGNRVHGCQSKVWLETIVEGGADPIMRFRGSSDAHIVKGLIYVALTLYGERHASEIAAADATSLLDRLGLGGHITRQRSDGFANMIKRIKSDARRALAGEIPSPAANALH